VPEARSGLRAKLLWLIGLRAASVTFLLGTAVLVQINAPGTLPINPFLFIIGLTYALTLVYASTLNQAERHRWMLDVQLACDAILVSAIIAITGGVTSYFASLYVLPIIAASIIQSRRGGLLVATLSALMYAALVLAQYHGTLESLTEWLGQQSTLLPPERLAQYTVGLNVFGFMAVAILSGYLSESLRHADAQLASASSRIADLQAFSQHVIDSLTSGLATTDAANRILTFNRAAEAITGHSLASVSGARIADILQLPPAYEASLEQVTDGPVNRRLDLGYTRADGRRIDLGLSAAPLVTASGPSGFLFTFQDVTSSRKLEREAQMQQRLAAVGEMAAGIAHEIRNPLASMSGSIQILRQELPLSEEQSQLMDIVLRESERLNDTIRSFLAYARPQRLAVTMVDLGGLLHDTAMLLRNSSECGDGHSIEVDVPETEVGFEADEGQMRQIVWNLATNGLRAMRDGGRLVLSARGETDPSGASAVVLCVQDHGVGIEPDEVDGIFQPFHGAFARGTGLGLAIVHRIVSDYQGEIQVTSRPGKGTTIYIRFPMPADSSPVWSEAHSSQFS
jgi:two-component system sensor histidine kinase PilS (NtrC family)